MYFEALITNIIVKKKNQKNYGCLRSSQPICKISQNVVNVTCRPHRDTHFLSHAIFSTIDSFREN